MPRIFDESGREKLRMQLLENGFQLIKRFGLKKTSVKDITKASGIATGTFYNFFKTKEEFVYQIILYKREQSKTKFQTLIEQNKMLDRMVFRELLQSMFFADNNIFEYLSPEEVAMLYARWPENYMKKEGTAEQTTMWILNHVAHRRPDCNWKVFANFCKAVSLIQYGKENLYSEAYDEMMEHIIDMVLDYVIPEDA
ncbi:TetR/AcrR family transcriptional regulator [Clostridium aminobutyricum]|uniref:TetR/AcrR family transcriptional regulator n=1 Tax=Clostridium aminobutyricum TaxID=33953 RepID=A0A939IHL2_CLOAM|nr:TetR/AcrR family transcriptional regulator [Clostridium aminobutyricum]MBN7773922.1 TetR/AcrR family transcriptional regulator [Clostridium aminobutyricum]